MAKSPTSSRTTHYLSDKPPPQDTCVPLMPLLPLCAMRRAAVRCLSDRFGGLDAGGGQASGEQASEQASVQSQRVASAPACGASVQSQRAEPARDNALEMRWRCAGDALEMRWRCAGDALENALEMRWRCTVQGWSPKMRPRPPPPAPAPAVAAAPAPAPWFAHVNY